MGLFDDVVGFIKQNFVPRDISIEGLASTPAAQKAMELSMAATPGIPLGLAGATMLARQAGITPESYIPGTRIRLGQAGREIQQMLDATGPGAGVDDLLLAGYKSATPVMAKLIKMAESSPEAMGVVLPLISRLGIVKPRGAAYIPGVHHFESRLAEALDKKFIAPGNPEDLVSIKEVRAQLGKLPGMGIKKEEIGHFDLANSLDSMLKSGQSKISRQDLAGLIDKKMPRVEVATDTQRHAGYTMPERKDYESYIFHAPPAGVSPEGLARMDISDFANSLASQRDQMLARIQDDFQAGRIPENVYNESTRSVEQMFESMAAQYGGQIEPFRDFIGHTSSGHYDQVAYPNILGWARTTRRPMGPDAPPIVGQEQASPEVAKYIEEIQSDWAKERKQGNGFPLSDINDLAMKYIDRISRQSGESAVGWTPSSVQIARWGGNRKPYESTIDDSYRLKIDDFLKDLGSSDVKSESWSISGASTPKEVLSEFSERLRQLPEFKKYIDFSGSEEGVLAKKYRDIMTNQHDVESGLRDTFDMQNLPAEYDTVWDIPKDERQAFIRARDQYVQNHPDYKVASEQFEKNKKEISQAYEKILKDKNVPYSVFDIAPHKLDSMLYNAMSNARNAIGNYLKSNPIRYSTYEDSNYSGFIENYDKMIPSVANRILKQRGGGEVFRQGVPTSTGGSTLEADIANKYAGRYPPEEGYIQPEQKGSFFYRIPGEQRGKPLPYPDSLWGLLGAAGLASMMNSTRKDSRQTQ